MNVTTRVLQERIDLAFQAIGGRDNANAYCNCDPSVGMAPCQSCALYDGLIAAEHLLAAVKKMSQRYCHQCNHVGYYVRDILPFCKCEQCGSEDTRLVRDPPQNIA